MPTKIKNRRYKRKTENQKEIEKVDLKLAPISESIGNINRLKYKIDILNETLSNKNTAKYNCLYGLLGLEEFIKSNIEIEESKQKSFMNEDGELLEKRKYYLSQGKSEGLAELLGVIYCIFPDVQMI